ncbi:hypothetical protein [Brotaphodocola sp.]|uniref:hypothetical protein n=1 Tax=Brotaphodocola sp. TaxID=3073577 RepID=UPI003D7D94AF
MKIKRTGSDGGKDSANPLETSVLRSRILRPYAPLRWKPERERVCRTLSAGQSRKKKPKEFNKEFNGDFYPRKNS